MIILTGAYGHGNLGDDLLAYLAHRELEDSGLEVAISAGDRPGLLSPDMTQSRRNLWRRLRTTDAVVIAGGGLFNDAWSTEYSRYFASMVAMARFRGAEAHLACVGIEAPRSVRGRAYIRSATLLANSLSVRDPQSIQHIPHSRRRSSALGEDLGWLIAPERWSEPIARPARSNVLLSFAGESQRAASRRLAVLERLLRRTDVDALNIRMVVMQERAGDQLHDDRIALERLARDVGLPKSVVIRPTSLAALVGLHRWAHLVVGYRLHSLLLGAALGADVVAISRSPKVSYALRDLPGVEVFDEGAQDVPSVPDHAISEQSMNQRIATIQTRRARARFKLLEPLLPNGGEVA